jgi:8-oxo-dGTP pyrophosphatase MutT (NUDIX family)
MKKDSTKPKAPRRASTAILIREEGGELQVFLLKRSGGSGFFPGNYLFPGGTVQPGDGNPELWKAHVDMDPKEVLRGLGGGLREAGVLLAHRSEQTKSDLKRMCERRISTGLHRDWARRLPVTLKVRFP